MAEGKKKVIVYTDWIVQFKDLTDEEAGRLIKHFFEYINDLNPQGDRLTELLFNPLKATLKRDLKAWESKQNVNRENGLKGGRPKKETQTQINPNNPVGFLETQLNPEKGVSDSVNDSVSVNVSDNDILLEKETKVYRFNFKKELLNFGFESKLVDEWLQVRKAKKAVNTETAFSLFILEVTKANIDPNEIMKICVQNSWKGFKSEWINNINNQSNGTQGNTEFKSFEQRSDDFTRKVLFGDGEQNQCDPFGNPWQKSNS